MIISWVAAISRLRRVRTDLPEHLDVAVLDVPPIAAQVHGDPVGPPQLGQHRGVDRVGLARPPRLAHGGHVVDVDAEAKHTAGV